MCKILGFEYDYEKGLLANENLVGLLDSVYSRGSCQYPISRYAIKYFRFEYITEEDSDADEFYKQNLLHLFHVNLQAKHNILL